MGGAKPDPYMWITNSTDYHIRGSSVFSSFEKAAKDLANTIEELEEQLKPQNRNKRNARFWKALYYDSLCGDWIYMTRWNKLFGVDPRRIHITEHYKHYPIYQKVVDFTYGKNQAGCGRLDN